MRLIQRALPSMVLMLFAIVALNAFRIATSPAQGNPPGEGQASMRSGDVNCDGLLDITDPILVLNWLFRDGPEPCAIAEADTCCTEVAQAIEDLKQQVAAKPCDWPPRPENRIYLEGQGQELPTRVRAYVVPEGKIFVLTDYVVPRTKEGKGGAELTERIGTATKLKRPLTIGPYSSALGIIFEPGSEVILGLEDATQGCSPTPCGTDYAIWGYLMDA